jgi:transposase
VAGRKRGKPDSTSDDSKTKRHEFSLDLKLLCVALVQGLGGHPIEPSKLCKYKHAPPRTTIQTWVKDPKSILEPEEKESNRGRPPLLTDEEAKVVGGFILFCNEQHKACTGATICDFIRNIFGKKVTPAFVSRLAEKLHFSSHRPAADKSHFSEAELISTARLELRTIQQMLSGVEDKSRIVALDQIMFWGSGVVSSTYSPKGGYANRVARSDETNVAF